MVAMANGTSAVKHVGCFISVALRAQQPRIPPKLLGKKKKTTTQEALAKIALLLLSRSQLVCCKAHEDNKRAN